AAVDLVHRERGRVDAAGEQHVVDLRPEQLGRLGRAPGGPQSLAAPVGGVGAALGAAPEGQVVEGGVEVAGDDGGGGPGAPARQQRHVVLPLDAGVRGGRGGVVDDEPQRVQRAAGDLQVGEVLRV